MRLAGQRSRRRPHCTVSPGLPRPQGVRRSQEPACASLRQPAGETETTTCARAGWRAPAGWGAPLDRRHIADHSARDRAPVDPLPALNCCRLRTATGNAGRPVFPSRTSTRTPLWPHLPPASDRWRSDGSILWRARPHGTRAGHAAGLCGVLCNASGQCGAVHQAGFTKRLGPPGDNDRNPASVSTPTCRAILNPSKACWIDAFQCPQPPR